MRLPVRLPVALAAGIIAVAINSAALAIGDSFGVTTAHGGLLRLLVVATLGAIQPPAGPVFAFCFHTAIGLLMAVVYGVWLERRLPGPVWVKGLVYAAVVYAANAFIVQPLLDEGVAGSATLTGVGMVWFAFAHTLFFLVLAFAYAHLSPPGVRHPIRGTREVP